MAAAAGSIVHFTGGDDAFKKLLADNEGKLVVVDFFAMWCGPCRGIAPRFAALASENADALFVKVDVDECAAVAETFGVSALPTFLFFVKGARVESFEGASADKLAATISRLKAGVGKA